MPQLPLIPQNTFVAIEKIFSEIDAAQARHNKVLAQIAKREASLLPQLAATTEKLNGCLERISKWEKDVSDFFNSASIEELFDKVRAGQCRLPTFPCSLPEAQAI